MPHNKSYPLTEKVNELIKGISFAMGPQYAAELEKEIIDNVYEHGQDKYESGLNNGYCHKCNDYV